MLATQVHAAERFKKRPTALDRHRTLVTRIQRHNRRRTLTASQQQQAASARQAAVATFTQQLRSAILEGQDVEGTWKPVATAAATLRRQEQLAQEQQEAAERVAEEERAKFLTTGLWLRDPQGAGNSSTTAGECPGGWVGGWVCGWVGGWLRVGEG
jgi:hypothetical protein